MIILHRSIAGVPEVVGTLIGFEGWQHCADRFPDIFDGTLLSLAQHRLELGENLFDRIEVGRVGWQEQKMGAGGSDRGANGFTLVAAEIVDDDDVAWCEGRRQDLLDVGGKALAVDRTIENARRVDAIDAQGGDERHRLPVTVRHLAEQALAAPVPAT